MKIKLLRLLAFFLFLITISVFSRTTIVQLPDKAIPVEKLQGYPVKPFKDTLFLVYNKVGSFSAKERANYISNKIKRLYEESFFEKDSINLIPSDVSLDIVYKNDLVLMSVLEADAKAENQSMSFVAKRNLALIRNAIIYQNENYSQLPKRVGYTALLVLIISLVLFLAGKLFNLLKKYIVKNKIRYFKGVSYNSIKILSQEKQQFIFLRFFGFIKILILIFIVYLSLPVLFSIFPATKEYTTTLLQWILTPAKSVLMGLIDFLPSLITIIVIVIIFKYALKVIKFFFYEIKSENIKIDGFYSDWALPTFNIIRLLMYAFMLVIIFPYLPGSDSSIFKGVSVFVGILFSLGSSNAIANMVAGLVITYMRPF